MSSSASRGERRRSASASRQRRLSFERCEARIALSAAAGDLTDIVVEKTERSVSFSDGGSITLSFTASDFVSFSSAKERSDGINVARFSQFAVRSEPLVSLLQNWSLESGRQINRTSELTFSGAISVGDNVLIDRAFDKFAPNAEGDYGMSLGDSAMSGPSVNSELSIIPAPMPTPSEPPAGGSANEGGQIALTPFVAPTGLMLSDGSGSIGIARTAKPGLKELGEAPAAGDSLTPEGMRGRAIVYQVAQASYAPLEVDESSPAGPEHAAQPSEPLALNEFGPSDVVRAAVRAASRQRSGDAEPAAAAETLQRSETDVAPFKVGDLAAPTKVSLNGELSDGVPTVVIGAPAARDAALDDWETSAALGPASTPFDAPNGDRDRRLWGWGLAAVISIVPLRRALRRRGRREIEAELPRHS